MDVSTVVILGDSQTFDLADNCHIMKPTPAGMVYMDMIGEPPVDFDNVEKIVTLREILDFYNKHNGTTF